MALQVLHTRLPTSGRSLPPWPQFPHLHSQGLELPDLESPFQSQLVLVKKKEEGGEDGQRREEKGREEEEGGRMGYAETQRPDVPCHPLAGKTMVTPGRDTSLGALGWTEGP